MREMGYTLKALMAVAWLLASWNTWAGAGVEQMHVFLSGLNTLQARFEQSVLDPEERQAHRYQGVFYLNRPNQFRWDYSQPEQQQIVADGRQIWLYEPDLEQVSVQFQRSALRGTPAMLLVSGDPVENSFRVTDVGPNQGLEWVELIPRDEESQFIRILLAFSENQLRRMEMADKFGQTTRFQFYDIQHNPRLDRQLFHFEPPDNADLYNH